MSILFFREVKKNLKSFLVWLIILIGINTFLMMVFESVAQTAENTEAMLSQYPEAFVKAMFLDQFDMGNILHYYASRSYILITLFGSVYAVMLSSHILSKEESERTIEFLISKPISRQAIISAKYFCVVLYIFLFNLLFSAANFILMEIFKEKAFDFQSFLLVSLGSFFIHLLFASVTYLLSIFITQTKKILSLSLGVVFITYFLSLVASIQSNLEFLKYFSPFSYYSAEDLVIRTTMNANYLFISFLIILVSVALSYFCYAKKDISV